MSQTYTGTSNSRTSYVLLRNKLCILCI